MTTRPSTTRNFDYVVYDIDGIKTCSAMTCGSAGSDQCAMDKSWMMIAKRNDTNYTYFGYYPPLSQNALNLPTNITIDGVADMRVMPLDGHDETWIVPYTDQSELLMRALRRGSDLEPTRVTFKTGDFAQRRFRVGDITAIEDYLFETCPTTIP
ncbi:MAG: hypothetical protein ACPGRD_04300 [Planktomarina sp.]